MSEKFNFIANELKNHYDKLENEKAIALEKARIKNEKERIILEQSGVIELFKEIRDAGLVKWGDEPATDTPAKIRLSNSGVNVSLDFNFSGDRDGGRQDTVKFAVVDGQLNIAVLKRRDEGGSFVHDGDYIPIGNDNLAKVIVDAIKNPIREIITAYDLSPDTSNYQHLVN